MQFPSKALVAAALALQLALAQENVTFSLPAPPPVPAPKEIGITIVDGEGGVNNVGQNANRTPTVRVDDQDGIPVKDVSVVFTLPADGASGEFRNGSRTLVIATDGRGMAVAQGLKANGVAGRLPIHVNASHRGLTARATITQFNMAVPGRRPSAGAGRKAGMFLAIAAGAAAGGVFATRRGNSAGAAAPGAPPISITVGSGTVGPPK